MVPRPEGLPSFRKAMETYDALVERLQTTSQTLLLGMGPAFEVNVASRPLVIRGTGWLTC